MGRPELVDNAHGGAGARHDDALAFLLGDIPAEHPLSVATGYVNLGGLHHLASLHDGRPLRLLIGAEPAPGLGIETGPLPLFERHRAALSGERDLARFPPSRHAAHLAAVDEWLQRPEVQVRRYTQRFLHGKAYLLGTPGDGRAALVTSANLTRAGLSANLELGLVEYGPAVTGAAVEWFNALWGSAADYRQELRDLLFPDPGLVDPATVYLRALLELHPDALADMPPGDTPPGLELAPFQRDGFERARAIVARHGGVVYADGVGTGKTEIGLSFIATRTRETGAHALVVAPAQLADRWRERILQARLAAQVITFHQLAADEQLNRGPGTARHLRVAADAYRLVVVDEAHALRNDDTSWYRAMEALMGGAARKELVLLSATPINNGLWDLHNLVMLFARHDRAFSRIGIDSLGELFVAAGANARDPDDLDTEALFPLADAVSVRRDRRFIEREYGGERFPDGRPVAFPTPTLRTVRYDLDGTSPGLFEYIADRIDALTMARYRPSAFDLSTDESQVEGRLSGLLKSAVLKRFESCWRACLDTVEAMVRAHEAFAHAWTSGQVPGRRSLRDAATMAGEEGGISRWVADLLDGDDADARPAGDFDPAYGDEVAADRRRLEEVRDALAGLSAENDPKLRALRDLLEAMPDTKVAVFATYAATVRYLADHLPATVGGRAREVVIGNETSPDQRAAALARFSPNTVVRHGYDPPAGEVDLLLATDVLSEGQNLQQAQAVISYDMPWNPQRVVQRNGRVIRLLSPHDEVHLVTMLPAQGELERLLGLEGRVRTKIRAAGLFGMESEVIEGVETDELRAFADRLAGGDPSLLDEAEDESGAFVGEELRRQLARALREGELARVGSLPWGIGACIRQTGERAAAGNAGVFFACRTPPMAGADDGHRYWRFVENGDDDRLVTNDLQMLRRIDPVGVEAADCDGVDLETAWRAAADDIVRAHNERADLRRREDSIGPRQRWAQAVLADPAVAQPGGAEDAYEALGQPRSGALRRQLGEIEQLATKGQIPRDEAARRIVDAVTDLGLQPVDTPPPPRPITADELGVVCWMGVLPPP